AGVMDVVAGALFRIAQHLIRLGELAELRVVSGLRVVGMVTLREQAIHTVHGLRFSRRADLEDLVIVRSVFRRHSVRDTHSSLYVVSAGPGEEAVPDCAQLQSPPCSCGS